MEFRQLSFFVILAEELHFSKAASRAHIAQSALSQQLKRLERELGVVLLERNTHHVELTPAGSAFLIEARHILAHVDRAVLAAQTAATPAPQLRVSIFDASHETMPLILREVEDQYPELEVHEIEAAVPEQLRLLMDGRLDAGIGRASLVPPSIASALVRLDPMGLLVPEAHPLAARQAVPVAALADEPLLLADNQRAPEFNQFIHELCRSAGFALTRYHGTVESVRAAVNLVARGRCALCAPASCIRPSPGLAWRLLVEPTARYPWSVLWRASDHSRHVQALLACARKLSDELGWLEPAPLPADRCQPAARLSEMTISHAQVRDFRPRRPSVY